MVESTHNLSALCLISTNSGINSPNNGWLALGLVLTEFLCLLLEVLHQSQEWWNYFSHSVGISDEWCTHNKTISKIVKIKPLKVGVVHFSQNRMVHLHHSGAPKSITEIVFGDIHEDEWKDLWWVLTQTTLCSNDEKLSFWFSRKPLALSSTAAWPRQP